MRRAAIPPALTAAGVSIEQVDVFEINEAFAAQALHCANKLGVPLSKLNPLGGAIASIVRSEQNTKDGPAHSLVPICSASDADELSCSTSAEPRKYERVLNFTSSSFSAQQNAAWT